MLVIFRTCLCRNPFAIFAFEMKERIFNVTPETFDSLALEVFRFQFEHNPVYRTFAQKLGRTPDVVNDVSRIPFLPVELFKTNKITLLTKSRKLFLQAAEQQDKLPANILWLMFHSTKK